MRIPRCLAAAALLMLQACPSADAESFEARAAALVGQMTLPEKVEQLQCTPPAIARLNLPAFDYWREALHGVVAARGFDSGYATVFPQCIGLAASWDADLMEQVATAISDEARAKAQGHGSVLFCPNINIARDPRWGRVQETFGEDPFLTSELAVAYVQGIQGRDGKYLKNAAAVKHFAVHSGPEDNRYSFNVWVNERDFRETYLPAFHAAVTRGKAAAVLSAYNRLRGVPCTANADLLNSLLRDQWGFGGAVISDAAAPGNMLHYHKYVASEAEVSAAVLYGGCDVPVMGGDLTAALSKGLVGEEVVNRALCRALTLRFRLGEFDAAEQVPFFRTAASIVDGKAHRALARRAAQESVVLLKNDGVLPLAKSIKRICVIGPNGDVPRLGSYTGRSQQLISPREGIAGKVPDAIVEFVPGCTQADDLTRLRPLAPAFFLPPSEQRAQHGLKGEYFANSEFTGPAMVVGHEKEIAFDWREKPPVACAKGFSVRWSGSLMVPDDGAYVLGIQTGEAVRLWVDGEQKLNEASSSHQAFTAITLPMKAGRPVDVVLEYACPTGVGGITLGAWGSNWGQAYINQAAAAALNADAVILVLGSSLANEDEERDRLTLALPGDQDRLLEAVQKAGKPTVAVFVNGSAIAIQRAKDRLPALVEAWFPGEEGGNAIADVLFGDYNPSGRLPLTFYPSADKLPAMEDYRMAGHTYRFYGGPVTFPFGFGLSYSSFAYDQLKIESLENAVQVQARIRNTSQREGDEVVQLYVSDLAASVPVPLRHLEGFQRIRLKAGESRTVSFQLRASQFSLINRNLQRAVEPGQFLIHVGPNQAEGLDECFAIDGQERILPDWPKE